MGPDPSEALLVACLDIALENSVVSFGAHDPHGPEGERRTLYRMKRAKLLDPSLSFSEALNAASVGSDAVKMTIPPGYAVSATDADLYQRAKALQAKHPG